jgi:proteasome lid subunit RPN8/RPN11
MTPTSSTTASDEGLVTERRRTPSGDRGPGFRLRLPAELARELGEHGEAGYPEEACGLLLGRSAGGLSEAVAVRRAVNLNRARARDRYELDPRDLLAAEREARERGLDVVGVWHSHPDHPAEPSATDLSAAWEGWSYVIVPVLAGVAGDPRSWRLAGDRFVEEPVDRGARRPSEARPGQRRVEEEGDRS